MVPPAVPRSVSGPPSPDSGAEREAFVDALRGFALLGILVVNIIAFASPYYSAGLPDPSTGKVLGRLAMATVSWLFETKFYLLFSFLFGYSFTLQMRSAERAGASFRPRILRRLAGLFLFGLGHGVLLFHGDILTTYAVLGLVLLMLRRTDPRRLVRIALWLVVGTSLFWLGIGILETLEPSGPSATSQDVARAIQAYRSSPATVVSQHLRDLTQMLGLLGLVQAPTALAMFLLGLVAGQRGLFHDIGGHLPLFRRMLVAGAAIGLPCAAIYAVTSGAFMGTPWEVFGLARSLLTAPLLTGGYVGGLVLLFRGSAGAILVDVLAPAGRMALSNYLMQSLICAVIFYAYGFRMVGEIPPALAVLMAFGIFLIQLMASRWWMERCSYGPLEWALRALTNLHVPALRRMPRKMPGTVSE
ncbi:MAG: DUF418 domain-containing protein [Telmatospirillum sp.]|nr:DUF418 domain-containing protein [Telmatospirillum sp.]